jgi:hypothetical protein
VSRLVVGLGAGLGGANTIPALVPRQHLLTKALGVTGDTRQWFAAALILAVVLVGARALPWLQDRRLI